MVELLVIIEKKYAEYLEQKKNWSGDDLIDGSTGECDLCSNKGPLTHHHPIPRRLIKTTTYKLSKFLDKLTIDICRDCHMKIHPEQQWYEALKELEKTFNSEAKKLENEVNFKLTENEKIKSNALQELNNVNVKNGQLQNQLLGKEERIKNLLQDITNLKSKTKDEATLLESKEQELKDAKKKAVDKDFEAIYWHNYALIKEDKKKYIENLHATIRPDLERKKSEFLRKTNPDMRDFNMMIKKIQMMGIALKEYDQEEMSKAKKEIDKLIKEEIINVLKDVLDLSDDETKIFKA